MLVNIFGRREGRQQRKHLDMHMKKIRHVGDPSEPSDVVTLRVLNSKLEQMQKDILEKIKGG